MFQVYCPHHGRSVLLFTDNIRGVINHPDGIELQWRCSCGAAGVQQIPVAS
jgi:hypothetical protein